MTGEELLDQVRWHSGDRDISHFIEINRALRAWCQMAGLPWLRDEVAGALMFSPGNNIYPLSSLGLRRLDAVYVVGSDTAWKQLEEKQPETFAQYVRDRTSEDGTQPTGRPQFYALTGHEGQMVLKVSPQPEVDYAGRVDGIASTPVVEWDQEIPGPAEYHDHVAMLAAGYHLNADGRKMLREGVANEVELAQAQGMIRMGQTMEADALMKLQSAVQDAFHNRTIDLKPVKRKIAR